MKNIQTLALNNSIARTIKLANIYKDNDAEMYKIFAEQLHEEVIIKAKIDIGQTLTQLEQIHIEAVTNQFKLEVAES